MRRRVAVMLTLLLAGAAQAAKPGRTVDRTWTNADFSRFHVKSIAVLPAASFDRNLEVEKEAHAEWGRWFAGSTYRWVSANTARDLLRSAGGDSLLKVVSESILSKGHIDSLMAPGLCQRLRTDALLCVRVDNLTQIAVEPEQSGKPSTTVQLHASLVDSTGQLLWDISGSETAEGLYVQATGDVGDRSGSATTRSTGLHGATALGAPPSVIDVLDRLFARWAPLFPGKPAAADSAK